MKRLLIIGNQSVVGKAIYAQLKEKYKIDLAGRSGQPDVLFDLLESIQSYKNKQYDAIIHCAASFYPGDTSQEFIKNEETNALGAFKVGQLAIDTQCQHIIYINSISAHNSNDSYGLSKKHADENLELFCKNNAISYTSLMPSQIYSTSPEAEKHQKMLYHVLRTAKKGEDIILFGETDPLRNFLYIDDLVQIIDRILSTELLGRYVCLSPESYRLSKIAEIAVNTFGKKSKILRDISKPSPVEYEIPNNYNIYDRLGFTPEVSLAKGLRMIKQSWDKTND